MIILYADVLFAINFVMVFFIFILGRMFMKKRRSLWLSALGAAIGSGGYVGLTALNFGNAVTYMLLMGASCFTAYLPRSFKEFFKALFTVMLISFGAGGIGMWLFYYTNIGYIIGENIGFGIRRITLKLLLSCCGISWAAARIVYGVFRNSVIKKRVFYDVRVKLGGREACFCCLGDTGNGLRDNFGGRRVIIAEFDAIKSLFKEAYKMEKDIFTYWENFGEGRTFCLLPYKSIGQKEGLMFCFKADGIEINGKEEENFLIGIVFMSLSNDGSFRGLINMENIDNGEAERNDWKAA